ncbi:MAG: hypothetical protein HOO95_06805 [Gallionella sp.]|nr:hypothetical protein [Gallionella sp.]
MLKIKNVLPAIFATGLVSATISGCVQGGATQKGYAKNDDCLFCHAVNNNAGVRDLSKIYADPGHHSVDIRYPLDEKNSQEFRVPSAKNVEMAFFDDNNNGKPDIDEVRVYMIDGLLKVTCSSCHREHERSPVVVEHPDDDYLRGDNTGSQLCIACHRK